MAQRKRPPARGRQTSKSRPAQRAAARPRRDVPADVSPRPRPFLTPGGSPFRHAVERRSAIFAVFLSRLPRALPGLVVIGLVAGGLLAPPPYDGVILLLVAALLTWLVFLSWPAIRLPAKAIRVAVIALVIGYGLSRFTA